jgi:hypothetical protein
MGVPTFEYTWATFNSAARARSLLLMLLSAAELMTSTPPS